MKNKISRIFKTNSTKKRVDELLSQKSQVERELEKIRRECKHKDKVIKQINTGSGFSFQIRWVCQDCSAPVGWPSKEEIEKFLRN
tara:strand:+ start:256 stop:510 length:255 start_codon:yes stop_codon:yes gene_type:complete